MSACDLKGFCSLKKKNIDKGWKEDGLALKLRRQVRDFSDFSSSESDRTDCCYSDLSGATEDSSESESSFCSSESSCSCCSSSDSSDSSSNIFGDCRSRKQGIVPSKKSSRSTAATCSRANECSSSRDCPLPKSSTYNTSKSRVKCKENYTACSGWKQPQSKNKSVRSCSALNIYEGKVPSKKPNMSSSVRKSKNSKNSAKEGNRASSCAKAKTRNSLCSKVGVSPSKDCPSKSKKPARKTNSSSRGRGRCSSGMCSRR